MGYHMTFYPDWLDFYREDKPALLRKFGSLDTARQFYGGWGPDRMLEIYREDLARAKALGASYLVFHVSDVSLEEGYTYRWLHTHKEVLEASAEIVNRLLDGEDGRFDFLMENQWWPGFTMTDPEQTAYLLELVRYPKKGILLDTGHLMNANPDLQTQAEGAAYIHRVLDAHGPLCRHIRGIHLHQSLSGAYVKAHTGRMPENFPSDYLQQFAVSYRHIQQIDQHRPWTDSTASDLILRIVPQYLTHELSASNRTHRLLAIQEQRRCLHVH